MTLFFLTTDFFLIVILGVKAYYGLKLSWKFLNRGTPSEEFLMEDKGEEKFEIRVKTE